MFHLKINEYISLLRSCTTPYLQVTSSFVYLYCVGVWAANILLHEAYYKSSSHIGLYAASKEL